MDAATLIRTSRKDSGLSQGELAARAGTSQPAISRYEAGASSPSVETLDRLLAVMGARLELSVTLAPRALDVRTGRMSQLRASRQQIRAAARRHHASNVMVFGSVARGEDGADSDIDLLVEIDVRNVGLVSLDDLRVELEELLGERVDVVARQILSPHMAEKALAEAVPL